jgi:methionine-rich copper-binding protein CopC
MTTSARRRTRAATTASLALALGVTLSLGAAAPAWAHDDVVDSTPAEGETLTALPDAFSVTASEPLPDLGAEGVFELQIRDAAGSYYGDGCVDIVDATMSTEPAIGESGEYMMLWQIVSADGHPVSGEIAFTWEAPDGFEPAAAAAEAPSCGGDLSDDVTDVYTSPTRGEFLLGVLITLAVAGITAAVVVAVIRRKRAT